MAYATRRKFTLAGLATALLALLLLLGALNAFNIRALHPGSTGALLVFTAVTVLIFLLLLALLVLLARNVLRMYAEQRSRVLGSRLRSRMLVGALLLSFAPTLFMFLFSYLLMNRSIDRWFSQPVAQLRDDSTRIALELSHYAAGNARAEAESLAHSPAFVSAFDAGDTGALALQMRIRRITLEGGFAVVYRDRAPLANYELPTGVGPAGVHVWLGETGLPGAQGEAGSSGLSGSAIPSGSSGPSGLVGSSGSAGESRPTGTSGPSVSSGLAVPSGTSGEPGSSAAPGLAGSGLLAPINPAAASDPASLAAAVLATAQRSDEPILTLGGNEYAVGLAPVDDGGIVVVALPMPSGLSAVVDDIGTGARQYWAVYRQRRTIRSTYLLLLLLLTTLTFFASSWLALYLSKQITRPVEALADAMDEIAAGDYRQRISFSATEELGDLIASFNQMAADLEESRARADASTEQLSAANSAIDERRHELELILETIPSGVVVLDTARRILQVNRAFLDLCVSNGVDAQLSGAGPREVVGRQIEEVLPAELRDEVLRLERRAQRMGLAGAELEMGGRGGSGRGSASGGNGYGSNGNGNGAHPASGGSGGAMQSLSVTIAVLNLGRDRSGRDRRGSILVVDDVTDVLQAQRQVAWKEVAQRVAHEIKNPLTPIALSAERIQRHLDRGSPDATAVIRRCSEVILGSVESMRTLVDQFAALAEFPAAQPRPASLNEIVVSALALFEGRLEAIRIESRLARELPPILADPEALKRAIANLIDNAAEAMQESLVRVLTLETRVSEASGMAELAISDTGPGLSAEMRERIFLPYFSTKQRGTGLGLVIAAKIVQDHQGTIRAEQRKPSGARFLLELPFAESAARISAGSEPEAFPEGAAR